MGLFLLVALPLVFKLIVFECGNIGKHLLDGVSIPAHAQTIQKTKMKAH